MNTSVRLSESPSKQTSLSLRGAFLTVFLLVISAVAASSQIVITNSSVTYTYESSSWSPLIPGTPSSVATPDSTLTFFPTELNGNLASSVGDTGTLSGSVLLDMHANPDHWFTGTALGLTATISYSLAAISPGSSAGLSVSFPYTLTVTGVDHSPFAGLGAPVLGSMSFAQPFILIDGPLNFQTGSFVGTGSLDINLVKAHFGIGAGNNITRMALQLSPSGTAWVQGSGSVSGNLANFQVHNQVAVVPEPSTYALLLLAAGAASFGVWRRRRA